MSIPLRYLPCKGKIFLQPILNTAKEASKEIVVENEELSETSEDPLHLNKVAVYEM